jgi:carbonic anhydrase
MYEKSDHRLRRRGVLTAAASVALAFGCGARPSPAQTPNASASPPTPDDALAWLLEGNRRFVEGHVTAPHRNLERLQEVATKQTPFAAFLSCADSRVPIEIVFDQGFGDVFVTRIAGNIADPAITASLEFGTLILGAKVLFVLGHSSCGAVSATLKGGAVPGQISTLYQHIRPATQASGGDLDRAIATNVTDQLGALRASPVIEQLVGEGRLKLVGGVYDLGSGRVNMVSA